MILKGEYTFQGPRELIFEILQDPDVIARSLPGARGLERVAEDRYEGRMNVGIGPVTAAEFTVSVAISDKVPPVSYSMEVNGKGAVGFTKGTARVELVAQAGEATLMRYEADLKVGGKIASVGQRLLDSVSKTMTKQGLEALNREVQSRLAPGAVAARAAPAAPSRLRVWVAAAAVIVLIVVLVLLA